LQRLFSEAHGLYDQGAFGNVLGFNPLEQQAQQQLLQLAGPGGPMQGMLGNALQGFNTSLNAANVNSNPYLGAYAQAALQPLERSLMQNVLPGIRGEAGVTGNYGGTRQGIAEGIALQDYNQTAEDMMTRIFSNAYGQGLQAQQGAYSMLPSMLTAQAAPAQVVGNVGGAQRGLAQQQTDAPFNALSRFQGLVQGSYGGQTTTPGAQGNPWAGALGGAIMGTQLPKFGGGTTTNDFGGITSNTDPRNNFT